jgi:hypothetical protein
MVSGKKECMGCYELIHEKAKKCPHCHQIQSKLYTTQYNKWVMVPLVIGLFGILAYMLDDVSEMSGRRTDLVALSVESADFYARTISGTDFVSCSGVISNKSGRDASDIGLRADFFNEKGELIDTFAVRSNLRINSGGKSSYRVRGDADKPLSEYYECKVTIVDQRFT